MNQLLARVWVPPHTRGAAQGFREGLNALSVHLVASDHEYRLRGLAQVGVGLGAGSHPLGSPVHNRTGDGLTLGLRRRRHLTQGGIVPCCSAWYRYGHVACHCRQKRSIEKLRASQIAKQSAPMTKLPFTTDGAPKLMLVPEAAQAADRDRQP